MQWGQIRIVIITDSLTLIEFKWVYVLRVQRNCLPFVFMTTNNIMCLVYFIARLYISKSRQWLNDKLSLTLLTAWKTPLVFQLRKHIIYTNQAILQQCWKIVESHCRFTVFDAIMRSCELFSGSGIFCIYIGKQDQDQMKLQDHTLVSCINQSCQHFSPCKLCRE